ncbi:MAG TPA: hypothetical protein VFH29_05115 [Anaerolineales bacterium]|nr:hypothetical protein [Anaerolineales bacterium]
MLRRLRELLLVVLVALLLPSTVLAQDYLFGVDTEKVDVFWNADGGASIEYNFHFVNQPGAHVIDFVDVGMPLDSFDMSTVTADVDGAAVSVSKGDYQGSGSGFAVVLGSSSIQPGQSGTVHVLVGSVTQVLREDTSDANYASAVFVPTFFGSQYVSGSTDLTVTFHLPPGVQSEEPRYHPPQNWPGAAEPSAGVDAQGRITYSWQSPSASAAQQYTFGASFPKSYVPPDAIVTAPPIDFGTIIASIMGVLLPVGCIGIFILLFVGIPILGVIQGQRRKLQYLPPKISIEGHGIKRGLTAVEAAILLEQPLDKVLTMALFGVVKKGGATVLSRDPLNIEVASPLPDDLHEYEKAFLAAFKEPGAREQRKGLEDMVIALVKSVAEKMKGFSRKETQDYYKAITEKAWTQVEAAQTPQVKGQLLDDNIEWTMLDKDYDDRSRRAFSGPIYAPRWWGNYDPTWHPTSSSSVGGARPASALPGGSPALPAGNLAGSIVGGVQGFSSKVIGDLNTFTSRVTNVTNPPPPPSRSSYRSGGGGGHSCACACACAGCACACAGGGR